MSDTKNTDWKERELGALWIKETSKGIKFLSGTINGKRISIWKNKFYEEGGDKPYYRIYEDTEASAAASQKQAAQKETKPDDIPF